MEGISSLSNIQSALLKQDQKFTLPILVEYYLNRIAEKQVLNAFVEVFADEARSQAHLVQSKIQAGTAGKLAGMVIGIKDNICFKDHHVSACSRILEYHVSHF
jgi:aspartyl-tRNA(Asn)/glutamyl-tRNA(Gln) amidotransferase subunit A